jgi:hypothetical protein
MISGTITLCCSVWARWFLIRLKVTATEALRRGCAAMVQIRLVQAWLRV